MVAIRHADSIARLETLSRAVETDSTRRTDRLSTLLISESWPAVPRLRPDVSSARKTTKLSDHKD